MLSSFLTYRIVTVTDFKLSVWKKVQWKRISNDKQVMVLRILIFLSQTRDIQCIKRLANFKFASSLLGYVHLH